MIMSQLIIYKDSFQIFKMHIINIFQHRHLILLMTMTFLLTLR